LDLQLINSQFSDKKHIVSDSLFILTSKNLQFSPFKILDFSPPVIESGAVTKGTQYAILLKHLGLEKDM
jgi:hypothetical protein